MKSVNVLDDKFTQFKVWIENCAAKFGSNGTLKISQISDMIRFLDKMEETTDDTLINLINGD